MTIKFEDHDELDVLARRLAEAADELIGDNKCYVASFVVRTLRILLEGEIVEA